MSVSSYIELSKPKLVALLVFTSIGSMIISASLNSLPLPPGLLLSGGVIGILASAGCNALTSYIDRDIDAKMERTRDRPLPSGRIVPPARALYFGLVLIGASLVLAGVRNLLSLLCISLGVVDNVAVYSLALKRRSPLNIILGGFSGGLAPLFGWVYVANGVDLTSLLIASMVVLWIPSHIWALAVYYRADYERARLPMLPVVIGNEKAIKCIVSTVVLLIIASIALYLTGVFGLVYLSVALASGAVILGGYTYLFLRPSDDLAWKMFKLSSPHLVLLFAAMILDIAVR